MTGAEPRAMQARPSSTVRSAERQRPPRVQPGLARRAPTTSKRPSGGARLARLQRVVVGLLALTWLPGLFGAATGLPALQAWSVMSSYAGLSWALPGLLTGIVVERRARGSAFQLPRLAGLAAGVSSSAVLLIGAATLIGP